MKKVIKWTLIVIPILLILGIVFIVGSSYFEHRKLVEEEKAEYPAPGVLVDVNDDGQKLHIYTEGEGDETLVFMSGFGTASPLYDFKVLYEKLSDDYRIAVVERAGYGWSDISSSPRDIDTVLEETRRALELAGESAPYVLIPHSMAGLEAAYWANLYPEEITTIIALDPLVPGYIEQIEEEPPTVSSIVTLLARSGLMRNQPDVFENNFHAMKKGNLTDEEAEVARTIFFRRVQSKNMVEEMDMVADNSQLVFEQGEIDIPFHAFISGESEEDREEFLTSYVNRTGGEYFILDAEHYIHQDRAELIAEKSKELIEGTIEK